MKNRIFILAILLSTTSLMYGQHADSQNVEENAVAEPQKFAVNVGFLMGGGSLIGLDLEFMIPRTRIGIQAGAGITSFGGGINYHLKDGINSPFVSVQYFYQGFGENHFASWLGPMFIYRTKRWFQGGIGLGSVLEKGQKWYVQSEKSQKVSASLLFHVGVFF